MTPTSFCRRARRGHFDLTDLLLLLFILALLISILMPSLSRARELAKRAVCASDQRGIAQGMHIYAYDNQAWFPNHSYTAKKEQTGCPPDTGVRWVAAMGSNDFLKISEQTAAQKSPDRSHPSRSLFLLIIGGQSIPTQFICPSSADIEDPLRNYGPDAKNGPEQAAQPGRNRFDFRGYNSLSYGYQLPYSNQARLTTSLDVRMAIAADKGPYYASGSDGLDKTKTRRDARSDRQPPSDWAKGDPKAILTRSNDDWRRYNSRNHGGEGQNIMFVDGHVDFLRKPTAGVNNDNIYTLATSVSNAADCWIGMVPTAEQALGPSMNSDSFIVP